VWRGVSWGRRHALGERVDERCEVALPVRDLAHGAPPAHAVQPRRRGGRGASSSGGDVPVAGRERARDLADPGWVGM
jgi:hypothetical protein